MEKTIVGVRFQEAGKIYYFEPGGYEETLEVGGYALRCDRHCQAGRNGLRRARRCRRQQHRDHYSSAPHAGHIGLPLLIRP